MSLAEKVNFAAVFPGQGSQYVGMGKLLYDNYLLAKEIFDLADDVLKFSLSELCFNGDIKELTKTYNAQPALLTVSYIMYQIYIVERNLKPSLLLGHSLGEITALVCANAISFEDGVKIARDRGLYMQECGDKNEGSMLAILNNNFDLVRKTCDEVSSNEELVLEIANYNSNNQIVVSGNTKALNVMKKKLKDNNIRCVLLNVSAAFHSSIMEPAASKLLEKLSQYSYNTMSVPVISNVSAKPYLSQNDIAKNLSLQMTEPVQWVQSINYARDLDVKLFAELGPRNILKNLNKDICEEIETLSLDVEEDVNKFNCIFGDADE